MALYTGCIYAPTENIRNLTHKTRIVYSYGGELVAIESTKDTDFDNPDIYYVVEQQTVRQLTAEGVSKTHIFCFTQQSIGRDGVSVCMIRNVENDNVRLMPRGV